jgi:hypothetical protein
MWLSSSSSTLALHRECGWTKIACTLTPRSELARALGYMNAQWDALVRYAADGTLEIDNLTAERALRG